MHYLSFATCLLEDFWHHILPKKQLGFLQELRKLQEEAQQWQQENLKISEAQEIQMNFW